MFRLGTANILGPQKPQEIGTAVLQDACHFWWRQLHYCFVWAVPFGAHGTCVHPPTWIQAWGGEDVSYRLGSHPILGFSTSYRLH